jgi:glutamate-1-semialdehyde 2,1-aminomutase
MAAKKTVTSATKPAKKTAAAPSFQKSKELFLRAAEVIPGAIYGHQSPAITVPGSFPYYAAHGEGAYFWDVDGNKYVDYLCAYGPMVSGYGNRVVDDAAVAEYRKGNCLNLPSPLMVNLAERLTGLIPWADWAVFAKNGTDVTTWCTLVAREHTGRKKIVAAKGEYHGAAPWCTPGHGGIVEEDRANMLYFTWNKLETLKALFDTHKGEIAGVIMTPFHHPSFADSELPAPGFWQGVRKLCDENGAVLILDDVRCGFRLDMHGSQAYFGFEPDLACYCKAIANGYPLSAGAGRNSMKAAAANVFLTGSYWTSTASMAAALANLDHLEKIDGVKTMNELGDLLMKGLVERGKAFGYDQVATGPGALPFVRFGCENNFMRQQVFCAEMIQRGQFLHPHHNWFLSAAHTKADIQATLDAAEEVFPLVKKHFGD